MHHLLLHCEREPSPVVDEGVPGGPRVHPTPRRGGGKLIVSIRPSSHRHRRQAMEPGRRLRAALVVAMGFAVTLGACAAPSGTGSGGSAPATTSVAVTTTTPAEVLTPDPDPKYAAAVTAVGPLS